MWHLSFAWFQPQLFQPHSREIARYTYWFCFRQRIYLFLRCSAELRIGKNSFSLADWVLLQRSCMVVLSAHKDVFLDAFVYHVCSCFRRYWLLLLVFSFYTQQSFCLLCSRTLFFSTQLQDFFLVLFRCIYFSLSSFLHSYTFDKVNERTEEHWHFLRFFIIREHHDRPPLPPPLIFLAHVYMALAAIRRACVKNAGESENMFREYRNLPVNLHVVAILCHSGAVTTEVELVLYFSTKLVTFEP